MARDERAWSGADPPGVVYEYAPSRSGKHGEKLLGGFRGMPRGADRHEAAGVVVGAGQGQLLAAMHRVAGVVDVQRDRRRRGREGAAEQIYQRRCHARHLDARRRVLQPVHGRLRTEIAAAIRRPPRGRLNGASPRTCVVRIVLW